MFTIFRFQMCQMSHIHIQLESTMKKRKQLHVLGVEMELFIVQMATVRIVFHVDLENIQIDRQTHVTIALLAFSVT